MKDDLGNRMKGYEADARHKLDKNLPVIARLDGKAFHTFCRGLDRPWDKGLQLSMWSAAKYTAERVQGCKVAYVQSDEISLLLTAFDNKDTQGWFDYKLEKMTSVAASLVTGAFLVEALRQFPERDKEFRMFRGLPAFDARLFNLPKEEVSNYFWWREQDCIRNSVQMLARAHYSHKQCANKSNIELKEMLLADGISWDKQEHHNKYGVCLKKVEREEEFTFEVEGVVQTTTAKRKRWEVDHKIPIFYKERAYVEDYLDL